MRDLIAAVRFSRATAVQRLAMLLDSHAQRMPEAGDGVLLAEGRVGVKRVRVAITEPGSAGGSLGVRQCQALERACARSCDDGIALVFVLDSAGARLDEGLAALGAFRRLYRAALDARLAGVPMIALLAKNCFGGASMLAALCTLRAASAESRYGMSGPGIVTEFAGRDELDASDPEAVRAVYGGEQRWALGAVEHLCTDDAPDFRGALEELVGAAAAVPPDIDATHRRLRQRLSAVGLEVSQPADPHLAFCSHRAVGALDCWRLADRMLAGAERSAVITLDCPGQAPTRRDEELLVSEFVAHLALCLARLRAGGCDLRLRITGEAGGGVYVALAAASRVEALPDAVVRVLPLRAVQNVIGAAPADAGRDQALAAGVVDVALAT